MARKTKSGKSRTLKIIALGVAALILIIAGGGVYTLQSAGEFKKLAPHSDMTCRAVPGVLSSEDIAIDHGTGIAFISSGLRGLNIGKDQARNGAIMAYDLNADTPELVNLTKDFKEELFPHGLGLYTDPQGALSLFVVNHRRSGDFVEIFDYADGQLNHRRSVSHDLMHNPNDVIPVGRDSFYVSNDHGLRSFNGQLLEDFLQLDRAYVLYFDGKNFKQVAGKLSYANGVNVAPDGKIVYVSETIGNRVRVYDRNLKTGALSLRATIPIDSGLDNIDLDADGNLWIGAHPKLLTFAKHAKDNSRPSPSQVFKISRNRNGGYDVKEMYLETGEKLSGSSVAAAYKNRLLIGGVFAPKFLDCTMKN